ncbi:Alpha/Beta hydrolase protein [Staphylotrichum tortipilum]|uniref:Alpha/Beta hydrolase protein n=1 Tax=Staphylotrichum tortipilum TaxID=2831512 RepID=A0AAN6MFI8_9PEZI|nr:Alpha/Beta hydrolase protein [Staphylotrichum longicolle]
MTNIDWDHIQPAKPLNNPIAHQLGPFSVLTLTFTVPLRHTNPTNTSSITLKADLLYASTSHPCTASPPPTDWPALTSWLANQRVLAYLCGGPGDKNPSDAVPPLNENLLRRGFVVLFLDYRGTGGSSPINVDTAKGWKDAEEGREYLNCFLQDSIVADLEAVRLCLGVEGWEVLGQSYGGWIATTYLSFLGRGLRGVYITGGVPPVGKSAVEVYRALYQRVRRGNEEYYGMFGGDGERVKRVTKWLHENEAPMYKGQKLTARGFLTMGRRLGGGEEAYRTMHQLVEGLEDSIREYGGITQDAIDKFWEAGGTGFKLPSRPLYAVLHEAIYCDGHSPSPRWAAHRVGNGTETSEGNPGREFSWLQDGFNFSAHSEPVLYFAGEAIFPFMLEEAELGCFVGAANALANQTHWRNLYDPDRLWENTVPVKAVAYKHDVYVDRDFSEETVNIIGAGELAKDVPDDWLHTSLKKGRTDELCERLFGPMPGSD